MVNIQAIANHYGGTVSGNSCNIPAIGHSRKDRGVSISPKEGSPDEVIINCWNGGDWKAEMDRLREDGFVPKLIAQRETKMKFGPQPKQIKPATDFEPSKVFEYVDLDGEIRYRTMRVDREGGGKDFPVSHPDGNGGWKSGRNGPAILYRWLDLIAIPDDAIIYMAEGEAKADKLAAWGFPATSSKNLPDDLKSTFEGRTVAILPDNDAEGERLAVKAQERLAEAGATAFQVVLPDLPPKGDIIDWKGSVDDLIEITKTAQDRSTKLTKNSNDVSPKYLEGVSARALMSKTFNPIKYIIPGYVAEGLTIFAGAPKIGKSWMAMGWGLSVAGNSPAFGSINPDAGDVLYLALEDNERRLQKRLNLMAADELPECLTFMTDWPTLDEGCVEQIKHWIEGVRNPRMVIVDVLAKVRGGVGNKETMYDADYKLVTGLQRLAGQHGVAIVMVHHTRKMDADDPFDSVSGTRGLTGAADTVLVLKPDTNNGQIMLYGRGRDIEEIETAVRFKADNGTWEIIGQAHEIARSDQRQPILDLLRQSQEPLGIREIADILERKYEAVRKSLTRMHLAGEIEKKGRGLYHVPSVLLSEASQ